MSQIDMVEEDGKMKITKRQLRRIIREACGDMMAHDIDIDMDIPDVTAGRDLAYGEGEGEHTKRHLHHIHEYSGKLLDMLNDEDDLPEWVQSKIAIASANIGKIKHYLEYKIMNLH